MGIGSILGGIAGLLIPGGGAIASALGSGIGTLLEGGSGKDAIKNALLAGGTSAMFPGVASAIQQSAMGKAATGMFGGAPAALNAASSGTGIAGAFSKMGPISKAYAGLSLGSMFVPKEKVGPFNKPEGYGGVIDSSNFLKGLYVSRFTGKHYDSSEARDLADQYAEEKAKEEVPSDYTAVAPVEYGTPVASPWGVEYRAQGVGQATQYLLEYTKTAGLLAKLVYLTTKLCYHIGTWQNSILTVIQTVLRKLLGRRPAETVDKWRQRCTLT
jgi:hypothetical protein